MAHFSRALHFWALPFTVLACEAAGPSPDPRPSEISAADDVARPVVPAPQASGSAPSGTDPASPAKRKAILIVAGGDVNLGRGAGQKILADARYDPFHEVAALWADADLRFVNLESQLSDQRGQTQSPHQWLVFTGPPAGADVLRAAGIGAVSIANNHMWDYGKSALFQTIDNLDRAGVAHAGARKDVGSAHEPRILHVNGWSVALFAVTHIWNQGPFDEHAGKDFVAWAHFAKLEAELRRAREEHDLVLVSYHGGGEYVDLPMQWTRDFVREVMRAGADAVLGHHPHVLHGVGWFGDRPAFFSLGNLVFAMHRDHPWTGVGFLARLTFQSDGSLDARACPFHIYGHVPRPIIVHPEGSRAALMTRFRRHLEKLSLGTGRSTIGEPDERGCFPVSPPVRRGKRWDYPDSPANRAARERLRARHE